MGPFQTIIPALLGPNQTVIPTRLSSIAFARAFPAVRVDGIDLDEASIAEARRNASEAGVADRVRFRQLDAADLPARGDYDAAFIFEALHDMARPVEALRAVRAALADGASLVIADEKVAETFTAPGDEVERLNYGFSIWHCLPATRAETPSAASAPACGPPPCAPGPRRPGSRAWRFCPSTTTCGASTVSTAERVCRTMGRSERPAGSAGPRVLRTRGATTLGPSSARRTFPPHPRESIRQAGRRRS
ncbi:MAG: SAM-dependent methyltransferase [Egibacteraceae bacterium]